MLGLAVTAALLGALAPVSWFIVRHAPAVNTDYDASMRVANQLLTAHSPTAVRPKHMLFHEPSGSRIELARRPHP